MQKKCIIYLSETNQPLNEIDIVKYIKKTNLVIETFTKSNDFSKWTKENNSDEVVLLICDLKQVIFNHQVLSTFHKAFIIWYNPDSYTKMDDENCIKGYKTHEEALSFIKTAIEISAPPEFTERVKISLTQVDKKEDNKQVEKKGKHQIPTEKPKKKDNPTEQAIPSIQEANISHSEDITEVRKGQDDTVIPESFYFERSRKLQKKIFTKQKWEGHKMIGVWAPVHCTGVTTFLINYSLFLAKNRVYTTVLEGLTENHILKDMLRQYTEVPPNWKSYAKAIHTDNIGEEVNWVYKNVKFLPLDHDDLDFEWNPMSIEAYMTTSSVVDLTLVDLPTGKMAQHTRDSLSFLDELWILVEDSPIKTMSWNNYIQELKSNFKLPIYLIFNKSYPFSSTKLYSEHLSLPFLTKIPAIHEEIQKNAYENSPLYFNDSVKGIFDPPFTHLTKHLFGDNFTFIEDKPRNWWANILKALKV